MAVHPFHQILAPRDLRPIKNSKSQIWVHLGVAFSARCTIVLLLSCACFGRKLPLNFFSVVQNHILRLDTSVRSKIVSMYRSVVVHWRKTCSGPMFDFSASGMFVQILSWIWSVLPLTQRFMSIYQSNSCTLPLPITKMENVLLFFLLLAAWGCLSTRFINSVDLLMVSSIREFAHRYWMFRLNCYRKYVPPLFALYFRWHSSDVPICWQSHQSWRSAWSFS